MSYNFRNRYKFNRPAPVTIACIAICSVIFLLCQDQSFLASNIGQNISVSQHGLYAGRYWGMVTNAFVHYEVLHFFFNMYWLWYLGKAFEHSLGSAKLVAFVILAAFVSSGAELALGNTGIGFSGVGYALFGFGWFSRNKYVHFRAIVNTRCVQMFIGWGILCVVCTYLKIWNIANLAHLGGLIFGATLGGYLASSIDRNLYLVTCALLSGLSCVPVFWNPMSEDWVAKKAYDATTAHDYNSVLAYYQRYLAIGFDKAWALQNMAQIYGYTKNKEEYNRTVRNLRALDATQAQSVEEMYGKVDP